MERGTAKSAAESAPFPYERPAEREHRSADWRRELRRKVGRHTEKKHTRGPTRQTVSLEQVPQKGKNPAADETALFDYRLKETEEKAPKRKVVSSTRKNKKPRVLADKPVIRTPVGGGRLARSKSPTQRALSLEANPPPPAGSPAPRVGEVPTRQVETLHKGEVILSRLLAGIIDGSFALLIALVFTLAASGVLHFDLISARSLHLSVTLSVCFFLLNSLFFFVLSGQTVGMYMTDLRLVGEESENATIQSILLRIVLFLPVAGTVIGLLYAAFDPACRCIHDRLSGTRIVPIS